MTPEGKREPDGTRGEMETTVKAMKRKIVATMTPTLKEQEPAPEGLNQWNSMPAAEPPVEMSEHHNCAAQLVQVADFLHSDNCKAQRAGVCHVMTRGMTITEQMEMARTNKHQAANIAANGERQHALVVAFVVFRCRNPLLIHREHEIEEQEQLDDKEECGAHARQVAVRQNDAVGQEEGQCVEDEPEAELDGRAA